MIIFLRLLPKHYFKNKDWALASVSTHFEIFLILSWSQFWILWDWSFNKRIPAPPFFKRPTPWPSLPPLFKHFVSPPLFFVSPTLKYFRQSLPLTLRQIPPALIRPTNLSWFKQTSKGWIYQFSCGFLSKDNFNLLSPFTNRLS